MLSVTQSTNTGTRAYTPGKLKGYACVCVCVCACVEQEHAYMITKPLEVSNVCACVCVCVEQEHAYMITKPLEVRAVCVCVCVCVRLCAFLRRIKSNARMLSECVSPLSVRNSEQISKPN